MIMSIQKCDESETINDNCREKWISKYLEVNEVTSFEGY